MEDGHLARPAAVAARSPGRCEIGGISLGSPEQRCFSRKIASVMAMLRQQRHGFRAADHPGGLVPSMITSKFLVTYRSLRGNCTMRLEIQAAVFQSKVREPSACLRQAMPCWLSTGGLFRQPLFLPSADARGRSRCGPI